ncbi:tetratricopeptide repeat protein [Vibrio sp. ZSDZ34]|uniref:Tetratricopeptide repeat protein n=1 Tax=Vibrio gelatinilyticus TaxID=2893468 RepID=A0A9X1WAQ3_9VIBR|nr:tetratricopeptide repeat protein [Vibrio gelatinilyticus]MCJ2377118.1 tetratricopeptide repeat protein [Vibrio gelatinilyticus]
MKGLQSIIVCLLCISLQACATKEEQPQYDTSLYQGRPIDTLTQDPPPKTEVEAIKRGDAALNSQNIDLALYEYIRSLSFEPSEYKDQTLYTIGRIHLSRGNNELAEQAFLMSVETNPNNVLALQQLGALYTATGRVDEGETYFLRSVNADQIRMNNKATIEFNTISVDKVRELVVDKESPAIAYLGLGVLSDVKNEYELARSFYDKAYSIKPNSVKLLINQGYSFYMSGDYTKAEMFTQKALKQAPNNEKAQNNMALIYLAKGQENKALNMFTRHMENYEALNNVGYFLLLQGKPENAVPYFQQAIDKKASYYKLANDNLERALSEIRMKEIAVTQ